MRETIIERGETTTSRKVLEIRNKVQETKLDDEDTDMDMVSRTQTGDATTDGSQGTSSPLQPTDIQAGHGFHMVRIRRIALLEQPS